MCCLMEINFISMMLYVLNKLLCVFLRKQTEMGFGIQSSSIRVVVSVIFSFMHLANTIVNVHGKTIRNKMLEMGKCDIYIYEESWVVDETYPMYNTSSCPYIRNVVFFIKKRG